MIGVYRVSCRYTPVRDLVSQRCFGRTDACRHKSLHPGYRKEGLPTHCTTLITNSFPTQERNKSPVTVLETKADVCMYQSLSGEQINDEKDFQGVEVQ